jgi:RNA polymerase sigma factor (sigma-70 family)
VPDDFELVASARDGDASAFAGIVERYQSLVCAIAYSGLGDLDLSRDVAQETFVAAWKGLPTLREPGRLRAWLAGIARHLMQNARRRRGRERAASAPLEEAAQLASASAGPLDAAIDAQQQALLWSALSAIPEHYREALVLFYREEQSIRAVAQGLELSEDAVKQRLSRGRRMLKDQVAAFVESALARTRPGPAFTAAVVAALPALAPPAAAAAVTATAAKGTAASAGGTASALAGAVAGPLLGIAGAVLGVTASVRNTLSARERAFMVRAAWWCTVYLLAFALVQGAALLFWPGVSATWAVQVPLWLAYSAGLLALVLHTNRRQRQIRVEDGTWIEPGLIAPQESGGVAWLGLAGTTVGAVTWLLPLAFIAGEPLLALAIVAVACAACAFAARAVAARPPDFYRIEIRLLAVLALLNFVVVNLRWTEWMAAYRRSWIFAYGGVDIPLPWMNVILLGAFGWLFGTYFARDRKLRGQPPVT